MSEMVAGLVSVVTPFLHAAPFIAETIESVRAQTHTSWELWLVDDGSSDGSAEVARRYAQQDLRITLLEQPDRRSHGASAARNLGLARARGEFIAFLDADDVWLPENLAEQVRRLQAEPAAGVLVSRTQYWHSWSGDPGPPRDHTPGLRVPPGRLIPPPEFLNRCIQGKATVPCPCGILVRHDALRRVGGFEERFPRLYDDQALYAKLFTSTSVLPVDECWSRYRQHPGSTTMTAAREQNRSWRRAYLAWLGDYVRHDPATAAALAPALRRELWRCRHPVADRLLDELAFLRRRLERLAGAP